MKRNAAAALFALVFAAGLARAAPNVVEAVQYPAWLERGGAAVPLTPGTTLRPHDQLRTGANARVQIKMGEGSTVKLGENARFSIDRSDDRGTFRAVLSVITGAFRFTTDAVRKYHRRDISIKVKNVTAGIRGTDLWGKSTDERDLVCLLEGKIAVGSEGHPTVTLDQPLDFYQRPRDGAPSVAKVDEKQIAQWAQETEMSPDAAGARVGGDWRVTVAAFPSRDDALQMNRRVRSSGYPSVVQAREGAFLVEVGGLAGESEARALMSNVRSIPGVSMPVIQPR
ncbi:MAG TPA: FecR domain-containing protein [Usitatibacter sp.]|nr:FecR domain-containing protein [Usitatibacter sp.]